MSMIEHGSAPVRPITAVAWSSSTTCPRHFTMISTTEEGAAAGFARSSFGLKSGYYLCYSKDPAAGVVVCDVQLISDKEAIPHGYSYIPEHLETKASVWKKKRVCVRLAPAGSVDTAVLDLRLTAKSKMTLQHYTCLGDMLGYVLWFQRGPFSSPLPQVKPRSLSLDLRKLSLDPPQPLRPSNAPPPLPGKLSRRRSNLQSNEEVEKTRDSSSFHGCTAIDGIPFSLHPKFAPQTPSLSPNGTNSPNAPLKSIRIKSVQDIENEYNYPFTVEESAAKRPRPLLSIGSAP